MAPSPLRTTPHRALARPNPSYYRAFATDQAAFEHSKELMTLIEYPPPLAPGDAMQKRAQAATDAVYEAYAKLYPEDVAGMPGPPRAIVTDDTYGCSTSRVGSSRRRWTMPR